MSPEYLAEEIQASIDRFEKGLLKHLNAYVSITYDALTQRFESISSKRKAGQSRIPKATLLTF